MKKYLSKKSTKIFILVVLAAALICTLFPKDFEGIIPGYFAKPSKSRPAGTIQIEACLSFSADPSSYSDLHVKMRDFTFFCDPLTLIPFLHQPDDPVAVRIDHSVIDCDGTGSNTALLWDGEILWVSRFFNHYFGYRPLQTEEFQSAMESYVTKYEGFSPYN